MIAELLNLVDGLTPDQMAGDLVNNRQRTSSRPWIIKAEAVQRFGETLKEIGIDDFANTAEWQA